MLSNIKFHKYMMIIIIGRRQHQTTRQPIRQDTTATFHMVMLAGLALWYLVS